MTTQYQLHETTKLLFSEAENLGLSPKWETHYGIFSMQVRSQEHFFFYPNVQINSIFGARVARNKHATHVVLEKNPVNMAPYYYGDDRRKLYEFIATHKKIVKKPIFGRGTRGVVLIDDKEKLPKGSLLDVIFEAYVDGSEYRYLVLQRKIIAVQRKDHMPLPQKPWQKFITNLNEKEWKKEYADIAVAISKTLSLGLVAVDFIFDKKGNAFVLEVNHGPDLAGLEKPHAGEPIHAARMLLEALFLS